MFITNPMKTRYECLQKYMSFIHNRIYLYVNFWSYGGVLGKGGCACVSDEWLLYFKCALWCLLKFRMNISLQFPSYSWLWCNSPFVDRTFYSIGRMPYFQLSIVDAHTPSLNFIFYRYYFQSLCNCNEILGRLNDIAIYVENIPVFARSIRRMYCPLVFINEEKAFSAKVTELACKTYIAWKNILFDLVR